MNVNYEVTNSVGTLLYTSPDRDLAVRFARERSGKVPGLRVEAVERVEHRTPVRWNGPNLRRVA